MSRWIVGQPVKGRRSKPSFDQGYASWDSCQLSGVTGCHCCLPGHSSLIARFILVMVALIMLLGCQEVSTPNDPHLLPQGSLILTAPESIEAGDEVIVSVAAPTIADGTQITLTAIGSFGPAMQTSNLIDGQAVFVLSEAETQRAGLMTLVAAANGIQTQTKLTILPGPPADPLISLVGPRSIMADSQDESMLVVLALDEWGNPIQAGLPVTVQVQHPAPSNATEPGEREIIKTATNHLLAWLRLKSGLVAGQTLIGVTAGSAYSPEQVVVEVPGPPGPFSLQADIMTQPTDGRKLVQLTTTEIRDAHGNPILDGLNVTFLVTDDNGTRRSIPATTINGRAEIMLQAPTKPGILKVQVMISNVLSEPLELTFTDGPSVKGIPIMTTVNEETVELIAGPLVGAIDQLIPDGTRIDFFVAGPDGRVHRPVAPANYGYATATLRRADLTQGVYVATVAVGTGQGQTTFIVP